MSYLLDTNLVTAIIKKNQGLINKLKLVNFQGKSLFISCITYYEIKRGLLYVNSTRQLSDFNDLCRRRWSILFLDNLEIIEQASEIYIDLRRKGRLIQDADILIAATAIIHNLTLVSNDSDCSNYSSISNVRTGRNDWWYCIPGNNRTCIRCTGKVWIRSFVERSLSTEKIRW
ncbi:MAG: type II toxin-antitoxin system VapC family toxin [Okeania sp. SIO2B3]|nr:type II toxin-antitoxin system VapC family toxin [Okeania sp. SIO2B3]